MDTLDAVIVGAGQAGLSVSYYLCEAGLTHTLLERGRVGESWRSQRWDSFRLNTPNFMNALPGLPYSGPEPGGFVSQAELVRSFEQYTERFRLPVRTGVTVTSVRHAEDGRSFIVETAADGRAETLHSRAVVIASGTQNAPRIPAVASRLPAQVTHMHAASYRNAAALPTGAVVVVGGGQTGCQIAEDLLEAGRTVYLCSSRVVRVPRRYRGREILEWWIASGFLDVTYESLEDKAMARMAQPQVSGLGPQGHTMSLQYLARRGAVILGRLLDVQDGRLLLSDEAAAHIRFADEFSQRMKGLIDGYIAKNGIAAEPAEMDPADAPDPQAECASPLRALDLRAANVSSIIWATGFRGDFGWIALPILGAEGQLLHQRGVSPVDGLYFVGFPWLVRRKSGILYGVGEDARTIAEKIAG